MTWRRVDPFFARRIQLLIFGIATFFGLDYLFTPEGSSTALTIIERTWLPLWVWGVTILLAGVCGFFVEWRILGNDHPFVATKSRWQWGWVSNISHIVLFALFLALTASSAYDIIHRGVSGGGWYGWRTTIMWGGYAFANNQYIRRLGPLA
jgi:cytochrome b561